MARIHHISADQLSNWAVEHAAIAELSWLIRRLVRLSVGSEAVIQFNTGKGVSAKGFDGVVKSSSAAISHVPSGFSIWEVSTRKDIAAKANEDFKKRSTSSDSIDRANATYIGVTLRRWDEEKKAEWVKRKKSEGKWKDVMFFDAEDISEWMDQYPISHYQLAERMGLGSTLVRSLDEWWKNWSTDCDVPISPDWLLAGRDSESKNLGEILQKTRRTIAVGGVSQTEALAFAYASIRSLPENIAESILARSLYIPSVEALGQVCAVVRGAILFPMCTLDDHNRGLVDSSNTLVLCGYPVPNESDVTLPKVRSRVLVERMTRDGVDSEKAHRCARAARNGVDLMRRELGGRHDFFDLSKIQPAEFKQLTACLLLNRWSTENKDDVRTVAKLAGTSQAKLGAWLTERGLDSPPLFRQSGHVWFLTDDGLAWMQCNSMIQHSVINKFKELAPKLLAEDDPSFEMDPSDRWTAGLYGKTPVHSGHLKIGVGRTLATLSDLSSPIGQYHSGQALVDEVIESCLQPSGAKRWYSVASVLPLLAEAAPERFLSMLEADLALDEPECVKGLHAVVDDPISGGSMHPHLLWALERLAWNRSLLYRASACLCRLHELEFGVGTGNSPVSSLREIYLGWHPNTEASVDERLESLDRLRNESPHAAWELLALLLPEDHSVAHVTNRPKFHDWGDPPKPQLVSEIAKQNERMVEWAVESAGENVDRLSTLAERFAGYPDPWQQILFNHLISINKGISDTNDRTRLWDGLRKALSHHRRYPESDWSMSTEQTKQFEAILDLFEPADLVQRSVWLFDEWVELPQPAADLEQHDESLEATRLKAINEIMESEGADGVLRLADASQAPGYVGQFAARANAWSGNDERSFLKKNLASDETWRKLVARGFVLERLVEKKSKWFSTTLGSPKRKVWSTLQRAELLLCLDADQRTLGQLAKESKTVQKRYWAQVNPWRLRPTSSSDTDQLASKFIEAKREPDLVDWLASLSYRNGESLEHSTIVRGLEALRDKKDPDPTRISRLSHDVGRLLEVLGESDGADVGAAARLEFYFMPLVRHSYKATAIGRVLKTEPGFFGELLALAYKKKGERAQSTDENKAALAKNAHRILDDWSDLPGLSSDGINESALWDWISKARSLAEDNGQLRPADICIGNLLAKSPDGEDSAWPSEEVSALIERIASDDLDLHVITGRRNSRGITSRLPEDGGDLERGEEKRYRQYADARESYTRTRQILLKLAEGFAYDAVREDKRAEMEQDL